VIEEWWAKCPDGNIAVRCCGWFTVDVDPRNSGRESWTKLVEQHGRPSVTPAAKTGGGGLHLLFLDVPELEGVRWSKLCPGVDLKGGNRGYILVAPSNHRSGRCYSWHAGRAPWEVGLANPPQLLIEAILETQKPKHAPPTPGPDLPYSDRLMRAKAYAATLDPAISGQHGHDATFRAASMILRGFDLTENEAFGVLWAWNQRCEPPWPSADLIRKVKEAAAKSELPRGFLLGADRRAA
jgi:hypothetical protein